MLAKIQCSTLHLSYINPCSRLPDLLALSSPEIELPTLAMDSDSLSGISLSGIINQFIHLPQVVMMMMMMMIRMMMMMIIIRSSNKVSSRATR